MERIAAAENIAIEFNSERWRLLRNEALEDHVLLEVAPGGPISYMADFARTRRLSADGELSADQVQRVVLGWSEGDQAWHLGLLLDAELAEMRESRWCEIAAWPDPSTTRFNEAASRAGRSLASVITRPFYQVPLEDIPQPAPEPEPVRPLPALPLSFDADLWRFELGANESLQLVRSSRWTRQVIQRILWYLLWTVVFIVLIVANVKSEIAPPNPAFLPLLGAVVAMILAGLIGKNLARLFMEPDRFIVDKPQRQIRAQRGNRICWSYRPEQLQSVYVSQVINRRKLRREEKPTVTYGEINLHLATGRFQHVVVVEAVEEYRLETEGLEQDQVIALDNQNYNTNLHAAGVYMAQLLDVPVVYDRRFQ